MSFPAAPFTFDPQAAAGGAGVAAPGGGGIIAPAFEVPLGFLAAMSAVPLPSERARTRQRENDLLDQRKASKSSREEDELFTQEIIRTQMEAAKIKKKQQQEADNAAAAASNNNNPAANSTSPASPFAGAASSSTGSGRKLIRARHRPPPEPVFTPLSWSHMDEWVSDRAIWEAFSPLWVGRTMYDSVLAMILARTDVAQDVAHLIVQYAEPPFRASMVQPVMFCKHLPPIPPNARTIAVAMSLTSDRMGDSVQTNYASVVWRERDAGLPDDRPESPAPRQPAVKSASERRSNVKSSVKIQAEMFPVAAVEKQMAELAISKPHAHDDAAAAPAVAASSSSSAAPAPSPSDNDADADASGPTDPRELCWHNWKLTARPGCRDERVQQLDPAWGPIVRFSSDRTGLLNAFTFYTLPREK